MLLAAPARFVPSVPVRGVIADALVPFEPTSLAVGYGWEAIGGFMADPASAVGRPRREHAVALGGVPAARGGSSRWVEPVGRMGCRMRCRGSRASGPGAVPGQRGGGRELGVGAVDPVSLASP